MYLFHRITGSRMSCHLADCLIQTPTHCCNSPLDSGALFLLQQLSQQHASYRLKVRWWDYRFWNPTVVGPNCGSATDWWWHPGQVTPNLRAPVLSIKWSEQKWIHRSMKITWSNNVIYKIWYIKDSALVAKLRVAKWFKRNQDLSFWLTQVILFHRTLLSFSQGLIKPLKKFLLQEYSVCCLVDCKCWY